MSHRFCPAALRRFQYWINERIAIHDRRKRGQPRPWTGDEILQNWFFTNPYREWDRVTVWFRENIREPLATSRSVLMATIIFRWFNLPTTGKLLLDHNLLLDWDAARAKKVLLNEQFDGHKIFTSAYIINAGHMSKVIGVCNAIDTIWQVREEVYNAVVCGTLQNAHEVLRQFKWLGGFMAYEVVTDLRHTHILRDAPDIKTWCHPGPGCKRGYWRVMGEGPIYRKVPMDGMQELLEFCPIGFEMREVEHSLCEFDKYERIRDGGRGKRSYNGR